MFEHDVEGPVHVLRMAHGKVSAMDIEFVEELARRVEDLAGLAGAVVVTGTGTTFSAGVDLRRVVDGGPEYVERFLPALERMFESVFTAPVPIVAAVNGWAIAGGCVLAAACDHRVLAKGAQIGATELRVGVPFPISALEILRYACGEHTDEVVLSATLDADERAVRLGLAHEVVPGETLLERAVETAAALATIPADTYRTTKEQLRISTIRRIAAGRAGVEARVVAAWSSTQTLNGLRAHLERRRS